MNAYELADRGFNSERLKHPDLWNLCIEMSKMLRQQADRIAELEKLVEEMKYEKSIGVYDLSDEKIANVWLFLEGKAQGVLESGGTFNFPVEFYKAVKELEK